MKRTIAALSLIIATAAPALANFSSGDAGGYQDAQDARPVLDQRLSTAGSQDRIDTVIIHDRFIAKDKIDFSTTYENIEDHPGFDF